MTYDLSILFGAGVAYLAMLFLVAYATENRWIPSNWVSHPVTYSLSLGVYASSWTYYGSVGFAESNGFQFLTIYIGVTLAFILSPVLLKPILNLTQEYQLTSLADLFAFRYRSQLAGILVTLFMLTGALPYIALQIRAVTESLTILTQQATPEILALVFCLTLMLFAILFGARHASPREKHRGLVAAIAFESLIKLVAMIMIGLYALFYVFKGPDSLDHWLLENPAAVEALYLPMREHTWFTLVFLAFGAAFLLPRQFHMLFTENLSHHKSLSTASWLFPLFLLLLNVFIPVILWAGNFLQLDMDPDTYVLGITLDSELPWLPLLAFLGGISAASAMVIVSSIALATMCMNHLILPVTFPDFSDDLRRWVVWGRRVLIGCIILAGYGFYALLQHNQGLVQLGLISFVAVAQFLPGVVGVLYWKRATRLGFITGLSGGIAIWCLTLLVPLLHSSGFVASDFSMADIIQNSDMDRWTFATFSSLSVNSILFVLVSFLTQQTRGERDAAKACCADAFMPLTGIVSAKSPFEFEIILAETLGKDCAQREVKQALTDLDLLPTERRASELRRLRERIEKNLSGLIGPQLSHVLINQHLELEPHTKTALADSIRYVEQRMENSQSLLNGLANELETLHRYHRNILLELPLGVCVVSHDYQINIWNFAMEVMSNVDSEDAIGKHVKQLPRPWNQVLHGFLRSADNYQHHLEITVNNDARWFNMHQASIVEPGSRPGTVILLEDLTDMENLEAELAHSDRLASIGRLAAGVAHEIGNPITGIASLAQNLRGETDEKELANSIDGILDQTQRINAIIQSLMNFSRTSEKRDAHQVVSLCEILSDAINLVQLTHKQKAIQFASSCRPDLTLPGDRQRLSQIFVNLLTNAIDASEQGGRVDIFARNRDDQLIIEVMDQGLGIPDDIYDRLFEPFVTSKPTGQGTGLGLALAYRFIRDHNGDIEIDSQSGVGTRVVVTLPAN